MSECTFSGNSDMYGLGIRIGFYLQWFGTILASWIARNEVPSLRFSNSLFVTATFLALVIQTNKNTLRPVEIYIILLLTFGGYLSFIPLYIWRLLTCCTPTLDPSRFPRVAPGPVFSVLNFLLLVAVSLFQLWFWFDVAGSASVLGCQEYGFFFARVRLNQKGFVVGNILLQFFMLLCCVGILVITGWKFMRSTWLAHNYSDEGSVLSDYSDEIRIRRVTETALQEFHSFLNLVVGATVLAATELTIHWNGIQNVNEITSSGQTIPLVISLGIVTRVVYIALFGDLDRMYRIRKGPTDLFAIPVLSFGAASSRRSTRS